MPSGSATLDAYITNSKQGYFFLGAEVENDSFDDIPPFTSERDPARNLHDRLEMHFGTESALLVESTQDVGSVPEGSTVEAVLRYLWDLVAAQESFWGSKFVLDGEVDEDVFWRDSFWRTVVDGLDLSSSRSTFGQFLWQRYDVGTDMAVSVNGSEAEFVGSEDTQLAEFVGYPAFTEGELRFAVYLPFADTTDWEVAIQPWRADLTDLVAMMRLRYIAGNWFLQAGFWTTGNDVIMSESTSPSGAGWYFAKFQIEAPGGSISAQIWEDGDTEPEYETFETLPETAVSPRWLVMGGTGKTAISDDGASWAMTDLGSMNWNEVCYGLAFGVPTWMATSSSSGFYYSRDGVAWTAATTATDPAGTLPQMGSCVTNGTGTWIGAAGATSPSSSVWRAVGDPATSFWRRKATTLAHGIHKIRWLNDRFVAVTQYGEIATSPDGDAGTWTNRTTGMDDTEDWLEDAIYGGGIYLAIGGGGSSANEFKTLVSSDGETWTLYTIAALEDHFPQYVAYGNGLFVVVGDFLGAFVATSPDGINWTIQTSGATVRLNDVHFVDGLFVAVGNTGKIYTTDDPTGTWDEQTSGFSTTQVAAVMGHTMSTSFPSPMLRVENGQVLDDTAHGTLLIDYIKVYRTDTDPLDLHRLFHLDAEVTTPHFTLDAWVGSGFKLDAFVMVVRSNSFTLDASVPYTGFVLDALVKATVSSSFTLDANTPDDHTGELGDFILGDDELGGG